MKYKLIKCYPCSPKLGYITNFDENEEDWNTTNLIIPPDCTSYPEFWEEVKEYNFEIIQIRNKNTGTIFNRCIDVSIFTSNYDNCEIYSVRRKSDGEIFTIGDTCSPISCENIGKIEKFEFTLNYQLRIQGRNERGRSWYLSIDTIKKLKKPLFTSEDGKYIYCGDNFWFVDNMWCIGKGLVSPVFKPLYGYKQFSSEDLARKYVEEHKPLFSKKQVINILKGFDNEINDYIASNEDYIEYINLYSDEEKSCI